MTTNTRFDRNERFFGAEGQAKLSITKAVVVGTGGLGSHVVQQLAYLGIGSMTLIDSEELDETNKNRYVTALSDDPVPGTLKVDIAERLVRSINPTIGVSKVSDSLVSAAAFEFVKAADVVFGCLDSEGARLVLTELASAYCRPYIDLSTDIQPGDITRYGGSLCYSLRGEGCLVCMGLLDMEEARAELGGPEFRKQRDAIYGVRKNQLNASGPSVVSINGVVASLATTEFMLCATGLREPKKVINYLGYLGRVTVSGDVPKTNCYYCKSVFGQRDQADLGRYIEAGVGNYLR